MSAPTRPFRIPFLVLFVVLTSSLLCAQEALDAYTTQEQRHEDPQWADIRRHLPDPTTATAAALEAQGDLLRIRRFPEDALDYYRYSLKRGGNMGDLADKIGLAELEMHNVTLARSYFQQALKLRPRDARIWNNLATTEYLQRDFDEAVRQYKRAIKMDKTTAIFHSNLSTVYFERKDYKRGRQEVEAALKIDPLVFQRGSGAGISAQLLSIETRGRFAFEMAKVYAQHGEEEEMMHSLAIASESGFDILGGMTKDSGLQQYRTDQRVVLMAMTAQALHLGGNKTANKTQAAAPTLEAPKPE